MIWSTVLDVAAFVLVAASAALLWCGWVQHRKLKAEIGQLEGLRAFVRTEIEQVVEAGANGLYAAQEPLFGEILCRLDAVSRAIGERAGAAVGAACTPIAGSLPLEPLPAPAPDQLARAATPPSSGFAPVTAPGLSGRVPTMRIQPAHLPPPSGLPFEGAPSTTRSCLAPPPMVAPPAWVAAK